MLLNIFNECNIFMSRLMLEYYLDNIGYDLLGVFDHHITIIDYTENDNEIQSVNIEQKDGKIYILS